MKHHKKSLRKCTACRCMKEKDELIRVVRHENRTFSLDFSGKANGRGAYICNNIECLNKAEKIRGLERSFKTNIPNEIYENLRNKLENSNCIEKS